MIRQLIIGGRYTLYLKLSRKNLHLLLQLHNFFFEVSDTSLLIPFSDGS